MRSYTDTGGCYRTCGLWSQVGARQGVQRWKVQFRQASSPEGTSADCQYALWSTRQPGEGDRTTRDAAPPAPGPRQWVVTLFCGLDFFFLLTPRRIGLAGCLGLGLGLGLKYGLPPRSSRSVGPVIYFSPNLFSNHISKKIHSGLIFCV